MGKTINPAGVDWIPLTNKYSATCKNCNEVISVGEAILWKKGVGVKHEKCESVELESFDRPTNDKPWLDPKTYNHNELQTIIKCQCCGISLDRTKDTYINCDRRTCGGCFTK